MLAQAEAGRLRAFKFGWNCLTRATICASCESDFISGRCAVQISYTRTKVTDSRYSITVKWYAVAMNSSREAEVSRTSRPSSPARWPAPRTVATGFPWSTETPPTRDVQLDRASNTWASCVRELEKHRAAQDMSLRDWATAADVSLSQVDTVVAGRVWPSLHTLGRLCAALDLRFVVRASKNTPKTDHRFALLAGPDGPSAEQAAAGNADELAAAWHNTAVATLRWWVKACGETGRWVADELNIRPATWSQARPSAPETWVSLPVMLAVAGLVGQTLTVQQQRQAWQIPEWDHVRVT